MGKQIISSKKYLLEILKQQLNYFLIFLYFNLFITENAL